METFLKKASWTDIIISFLFIMFGIILMTKPDFVMSMISFFLGTICMIMGLLKGVDYLASGRKENYRLIISIITIIGGIIIMFCTNMIASIFRILIALWIIYNGIMNLQTTILWKDYQSKLWLLAIILAIATIIVGIYILIKNGAMLQIIGGIIIIYGMMNIIESSIFMKKIENYLD